jgi:hypothetical protein
MNVQNYHISSADIITVSSYGKLLCRVIRKFVPRSMDIAGSNLGLGRLETRRSGRQGQYKGPEPVVETIAH